MEDGVRERAPYGLQHVEVPSRRSLQLDPREPGVHDDLDIAEEHVDRVLYAEIGPGHDLTRLATEQGVQRYAGRTHK